MRPHPSTLPLLFVALLLGTITLAFSCQPHGPVLEELPISTTILHDFSDPNTYHAWEAWSCLTGPDFFAAIPDRLASKAHRVELTGKSLRSKSENLSS